MPGLELCRGYRQQRVCARAAAARPVASKVAQEQRFVARSIAPEISKQFDCV